MEGTAGLRQVTVIFTCFNRREKTECCMRSISENNPSLVFDYVVLDDNSSDGTSEMLEHMKRDGWQITVLHGDGNSYWAGGMRKAISYAKQHAESDYYLLVNDDVEFYAGAVEKLVKDADEVRTETGKPVVMVGPMCDESGRFSYGGIRYQNGIHYTEVKPEDAERSCDSFNMNCILLEKETFLAVPNFDEHYIHSLADFDYGLTVKRMGITMLVTDCYAGICPDNDPTGGWSDRSLSRVERLKKKESIKGAPFKPWFYFLGKNFGLKQALLHGFTPYIRILLGR